MSPTRAKSNVRSWEAALLATAISMKAAAVARIEPGVTVGPPDLNSLKGTEGAMRLRNRVAYADFRTALSTSVLPSDQIAPGTLWLEAITSSNDFSIQLQSSSVITSGGSSLMVWLPWPETWVRIL